MNLIKTAFASAALLAGGIFAMTPEPADAQVRIQIGGGNYGYGNYGGGYGYGNPGWGGSPYRGGYGGSGFRNGGFHNHGGRYNNGAYSTGYRGYGPGTGYGGYGTHYHPGYAVPHGDHVDVVPGHVHGGYGH